MPVIGVSARAKGKWKVISPFPNSEEIKDGGSPFIVVKEFLTLNNIYLLKVSELVLLLY